MEFIRTAYFEKQAVGVLNESDLMVLEEFLIMRPDAGAVIVGSGGVRKVRVPAMGKSKSGGARVIYYWAQSDSLIFLLSAYAKSYRGNLNGYQAKLLREAAGL